MNRTSTGTVALALSAVAVVFWLLSYSWLLGLVLPQDVVDAVLSEERLDRLGVSPWLVAELAAIPTGFVAAVLGAWAVARKQDSRRVPIRVMSIAAAVVAVLALVEAVGQV